MDFLLPFFTADFMGKPAWVWLTFVGIIGKMPAVMSLSVTFGLISGGVLVSLWKTRGQPAVAEST